MTTRFKSLKLGSTFSVKALIALAMSASLSACGFHLLGTDGAGGWNANNTAPLPHSVAFVGDTDNEIVDFLKQQKPTNVSYATPDKADLTLDMGSISSGKSTLSTNSAGTATEYRVTLSVIIQIYDAQKNQLLKPTRLTTARNLIVGAGYATAEDAEYERLRTDMAQELANSIAYRVRAAWFSREQHKQ